MEIPVYLFTGFLEAGKTSFIKETMQDPNFNNPDKRYLIITCEDGEEEFEAADFADNVHFASFDDPQLLTPDRLSAVVKRAHADIAVVEYNGMWTIDKFYNALPEDFMVYQEIMVADSTTFPAYNANMRQLVVDKLTSCEMVVFNRFKPEYDKLTLHKIVRGVSKRASICYEDMAGEIEFDDIEDPLPYDLGADVVEIGDDDFAVFYRDMNEEFGKYKGKTLRFKGIVALDPSLPRDSFAIGRHIMVCCADDIAYRGVVAKGTDGLKLKTRDWVIAEGRLVEEYSKLYKGVGPVLYVDRLERAEKPVQEVATFY